MSECRGINSCPVCKEMVEKLEQRAIAAESDVQVWKDHFGVDTPAEFELLNESWKNAAITWQRRGITGEAENAKLQTVLENIRDNRNIIGTVRQYAASGLRLAVATLTAPAPTEPFSHLALNPDMEWFCNICCTHHPLPKCVAPTEPPAPEAEND